MPTRTAKAGSSGCSPRMTTWPTPWIPTPTRNCWTTSNREPSRSKKLEAKLIMPFIPHTEKDTEEMLATIGVPDIASLFDEIPEELLIKDLEGIPDAMNEMEIGRLMRARA